MSAPITNIYCTSTVSEKLAANWFPIHDTVGAKKRSQWKLRRFVLLFSSILALAVSDLFESRMQAAPPGSVPSQLSIFMAAQAKRAVAYTKFERGFATHLIGGALPEYEALCAEVTVTFNECSNQIKSVSHALRTGSLPRPDLADILGSIQNEERKKLQLTAQLQVLRQGRKSLESSLDHSSLPALDARWGMHTVNALSVDGDISNHNATQTRSSVDCMCEIQTTTKALQLTIDTINGYIEEIRCELEDLEELNVIA